jgi:hypothetical protein
MCHSQRLLTKEKRSLRLHRRKDVEEEEEVEIRPGQFASCDCSVEKTN